MVPGYMVPQGLGLQGSGSLHWMRGWGSGRSPCSPRRHLHMASPSWGIHIAVWWQGEGAQGFLGGGGGRGVLLGGGGGGGVAPRQVLAHPSKQQRAQLGQSRSGTPGDQQGGRGGTGGHCWGARGGAAGQEGGWGAGGRCRSRAGAGGGWWWGAWWGRCRGSWWWS